MTQTVCWTDITDQVRQLPSPLHDRILAIMQSVDKRYRRLGSSAPDAPQKSRFTEWVNHGAGGHQIRVIGGTYDEEQRGPLRRLFCMLYDSDPTTHVWTNIRLEILGVDREHPEHREAGQWNPTSFERWFRDLRRAIVAVATTGDPATHLPDSACVPLKAYVPARCDWQPMCAFHEYMLRNLEKKQGGYLINPTAFEPLSDWFDFEFVMNCA